MQQPSSAIKSSRGPASRALAWALVWSLLYSATPSFAHTRHTSQSITPSKLPPHERALQALNRLTFGPRPGDVERVEAMGVDRWIDQQLQPETIDDSALEARLDSYPAMRLSQRDLLLKFPSEALIRAAADGKIPIPSDPTVRAIYNDRIAAYEQKQAEQKQAALANPTTTAPVTQPPNTIEDPSRSPSIKAREQHLFSDLAATTILNLPPAARVAKIVSMQPADFEAFEKSLSKISLRSNAKRCSPCVTPRSWSAENFSPRAFSATSTASVSWKLL
jgi:hypothetical protein